jgi:hypothetical protein
MDLYVCIVVFFSLVPLVMVDYFSSFFLKSRIFIAYLMAMMLSCDTIGSVMFLGIEKACFSFWL